MGKRGLAWAVLLLLLLWRLLFPAAVRELRGRAEELFFPAGSETVAAWGRSLGEKGGRIAVLRPGEGP